MCGIAGAIDLDGRRPLPTPVLHAMAAALGHRGPDEEGFFEGDGVSLAVRRLSIVDVEGGSQPVTDESGQVTAVFNGELFDHDDRRRELEGRGHVFRSRCDSEIVPHLWREHGDAMFDRLQGQFAFALWDATERRLILARDRSGICPLYWTLSRGFLLFASEMKALFASGMVERVPDRRGVDHVFSFLGTPGPLTPFRNVSLLPPGHFVNLRPEESTSVVPYPYWRASFPDRGGEKRGREEDVVERFEELLLRAVEKRLRADVPVVSYLSGGVDSSLVVAMASEVAGRPPRTFTIKIDDPRFDESEKASAFARSLGSEPVVVPCSPRDVVETYPRLVEAAEIPVTDTSCAALILIAETIRDRGFKAALTGDGPDELLAGYSWFKANKLFGVVDTIPAVGPALGRAARRAFLRALGTQPYSDARQKALVDALGGSNPWTDFHGIVSLGKRRVYSDAMSELALGRIPYADVEFDLESMSEWHPMNRALHIGTRMHLAGHQLIVKGDRPAMHSSVETRYPYLDEDVVAFLETLHPSWKLRGFRDKYLLRKVAERWLPREIAHRPKAMFRAAFDAFETRDAPEWVGQLLSDESLNRSGYFDPSRVAATRRATRRMRRGSLHRDALEISLSAVFSTQLWHHLFIDDALCELPGWSPPPKPSPVSAP